MSLKNFDVEYMKPDKLVIELRFDIATARASGARLVRLSLSPSDSSARGRLLTTVARKLAAMKKEGAIQFFATQRSFAEKTTEATYLLNKYPELADDPSLSEDSRECTVFVGL